MKCFFVLSIQWGVPSPNYGVANDVNLFQFISSNLHNYLHNSFQVQYLQEEVGFQIKSCVELHPALNLAIKEHLKESYISVE